MKRLLKNTNKKDTIVSMHGKTTPQEIAQEINTYFANIGNKLASEIGPSQIELQFGNLPNIPLLKLQETTPDEVLKLLNGIADSKATG